MDTIILLYSISYLLSQLGLIYLNPNRKKTHWRVYSIFYRFWLLALDLTILKIYPYQNDWYQINSYPIWLIFSIVFYYINRHCLRNIYQYQYLVHLYHPETQLYSLGHYYSGFMYSAADFLLKFMIVITCLKLNIYLVFLFLMIMSNIDTWFYYNNISDNTGETFHKLVGVIFHIVHRKD